MSIKIADLTFEVARAVLLAYADEESLVWDIEIVCQPRTILDTKWAPHFKTNQLLLSKRGDLSHWSALSAPSIQWQKGNDKSEGDCKGEVFIFEHTAANNCALSINHEQGDRFRLIWTGVTDVFFSKERYWDNVSFQIDTMLTFDGVLCGRMSEQEARHSVASFLSPSVFEFQPGPPSKLRPRST